jgi:5'-nucleotidase
MRILLSNDDGVHSIGIKAAARRLSEIAEVIVVAPDSERSAIGTAVSLRKPLQVQKVAPICPGVKTYAVNGTPSDSVILALGKIIQDKVDLVVSGINQGSNMGEDVLISGTVGAALSAYLRQFNALALSVDFQRVEEDYLDKTAVFSSLLSKRINRMHFPSNLFLNMNMPDTDISAIRGIKITSLAHKSHVNTVEEGHDGEKTYYTLVRESINHSVKKQTDIWAADQGCISITPLNLFLNGRVPRSLLEKLIDGLVDEFRQLL